MTWNVAVGTGGLLASRCVQLEIEAQAVKQPEDIAVAPDEESKPEERPSG